MHGFVSENVCEIIYHIYINQNLRKWIFKQIKWYNVVNSLHYIFVNNFSNQSILVINVNQFVNHLFFYNEKCISNYLTI